MTAGAAAAGPADPLALEREVRRVLDEVKDPCSVAASVPMGLDEMGIIKSVRVGGGGQVEVEIRLTSPFCEMVPFFKRETLDKVGRIPGVTAVSFTHDRGWDWDPDMIAPAAQARRRERLIRLRSLPLTSPSVA
jgi:metal-sulfur cluster biosynthetic enzyme